MISEQSLHKIYDPICRLIHDLQISRSCNEHLRDLQIRQTQDRSCLAHHCQSDIAQSADPQSSTNRQWLPALSRRAVACALPSSNHLAGAPGAPTSNCLEEEGGREGGGEGEWEGEWEGGK